MKKAVTLLLSGLMLCSITANAYANELVRREPYVVLKFRQISTASLNLTINDLGSAEIKADLNAQGCEKTKITCNLQQQNSGSWETLRTFEEEDNSSYLNLYGSWNVMEGYNYRIQVTFYAYRNGIEEITTKYYNAYY